MRSIQKIKLAVDATMTVALLLLMPYGLVGESAHEWIGMGMFALFVAGTPYTQPKVAVGSRKGQIHAHPHGSDGVGWNHLSFYVRFND